MLKSFSLGLTPSSAIFSLYNLGQITHLGNEVIRPQMNSRMDSNSTTVSFIDAFWLCAFLASFFCLECLSPVSSTSLKVLSRWHGMFSMKLFLIPPSLHLQTGRNLSICFFSLQRCIYLIGQWQWETCFII